MDYQVRTLRYIDDQTRITLTETDHSPSITISGSQLRELALNPDEEDRLMHLNVLLKALDEYEKIGYSVKANDWIAHETKYIDKENIKPGMKTNDIMKQIKGVESVEHRIDKKKISKIILP